MCSRRDQDEHQRDLDLAVGVAVGVQDDVVAVLVEPGAVALEVGVRGQRRDGFSVMAWRRRT